MTPKGTASLTVDIEDWYHIPSVCGSSFSQFRDVEKFAGVHRDPGCGDRGEFGHWDRGVCDEECPGELFNCWQML